MRLISKAFLYLTGWKITAQIPLEEYKKMVVIMAPHTSYWDFFIGSPGFRSLGIKNVKFLIKKELYRFPYKTLFHLFNGIPVERGDTNNLVKQLTDHFKKNDEFVILITPEGTRKRTSNWKKGFYFIATHANVPIGLGYLDYAKKEGGIGKIFHPTGDYEKDMAEIWDFYNDKTAKFPKNFNLSPMYREK